MGLLQAAGTAWVLERLVSRTAGVAVPAMLPISSSCSTAQHALRSSATHGKRRRHNACVVLSAPFVCRALKR